MGRGRKTIGTGEPKQPGQRRRLSLSSWILIALFAGILTGLFFGEMVSWLNVVGMGFIKLLQMTVLPYIVVSLLVGLGGLTMEKAKRIASRVALLTLLLWATGLLVVFLMPLTFPGLTSAAFFSDAALRPRGGPDFLSMYIPANPFESLANAAVPAVVLFSATVGVALIGVKEKKGFLEVMRTFSAALTRVTKFIVKLMPIGIFAITAASAGTIGTQDLSRLWVYVFAHALAALILAFWLMPMFLTTFTPFRYRDVVGISRDALITAFATGNLFIVLPVITESAKELFRKYEASPEEAEGYADVIVPVTFTFPNVGKLLAILFVLFAGWFSDKALGVTEYPGLAIGGVLSLFGGSSLSVPFLLDVAQLPSDLFRLFLMARVLTVKFMALAAAMHLLVVTVGSTAMLLGIAKIRFKRMVVSGAAAFLLVVVVLVGTRGMFGAVMPDEYRLDEVIMNMRVAQSGDEVVVPVVDADPTESGGPAGVKEIIERGVLRVGYVSGQLPFSYMNAQEELVGFDIELTKRLARDLGVKIEYVPYDRARGRRLLETGRIDIGVSGTRVTAENLLLASFTDPVLNLNMGLLILDNRRDEFPDLESLRTAGRLKFAVVGDYPVLDRIRREFENVELVTIPSEKHFFDHPEEEFDGLVTSMQAGMAWSVLRPEYTTAFEGHVGAEFPVAYVLAEGNLGLQAYLNSWLALQRALGTIDALYDYWILGKDAAPRRPRWSIVRDVLGWVD